MAGWHDAPRSPSGYRRSATVVIRMDLEALETRLGTATIDGDAITGSVKAGINWGAEGPRAGFFPFYIGIFIVASSAINLWNGLREDNDGLFAEWGQLRHVMSVVIPTAIYVGAMPFTGLYVACFRLRRSA